jgi:hypothetical protein
MGGPGWAANDAVARCPEPPDRAIAEVDLEGEPGRDLRLQDRDGRRPLRLDAGLGDPRLGDPKQRMRPGWDGGLRRHLEQLGPQRSYSREVLQLPFEQRHILRLPLNI